MDYNYENERAQEFYHKSLYSNRNYRHKKENTVSVDSEKFEDVVNKEDINNIPMPNESNDRDKLIVENVNVSDNFNNLSICSDNYNKKYVKYNDKTFYNGCSNGLVFITIIILLCCICFKCD